MQAVQAELQNLHELQDQQGGGEELLQELDTQWKDTQRAFKDRSVKAGEAHSAQYSKCDIT